MLWKKKAAAAVAVASVALGLSLVTATPAAAASGTWVRYGNTNPITSSSSTWRCGGSESVGTNLVAQVCAVRSPAGTGIQGAVIVRNNANYDQSINVTDMALHRGTSLGSWGCETWATMLRNSWTVCFGATIKDPYPSWGVFAWGYANATRLDDSPEV
jgi:hypothetical protein